MRETDQRRSESSERGKSNNAAANNSSDPLDETTAVNSMRPAVVAATAGAPKPESKRDVLRSILSRSTNSQAQEDW
jgi:hypothetical protein